MARTLTDLPRGAADHVARGDLLSALQPASKYTFVPLTPGALYTTFVTWPYQADYAFLCREDQVTLIYGNARKLKTTGTSVSWERRPQGVETQPLFHIEHLPVTASPDDSTTCDARHLGAKATWFVADDAWNAARAANLFRLAEDELRAGRVKPDSCERGGADACGQWILSLDDSSKIDSVAACPSSPDQTSACYKIEFVSGETVTIVATMPADYHYLQITPTAIKGVNIARTPISVIE